MSVRFGKLVGLLWLIGISGLVAGQERDLTLRQYSSSSGLSQTTVTTLFIDPEGFLWVGTCNGLNKLQGNHLTRVDKDKSHQPVLENNTIRSISAIHRSTVYIGTEYGAYQYHRQSKTFEKINALEFRLKDNAIKPYQAGNFLCLVSREDKLLAYDLITRKSSIIPYLHVEGSHAFTVSGHNAYWISHTPARLFELNGITGKVNSYLLSDDPEHGVPCGLSVTDQKEIIVTFTNGFLIFNPKNGLQHFHSLQSLGLAGVQHSASFRFAIRAPDSSLWLGIKDFGVVQLDQKNQLKAAYTGVYDNGDNGYFDLKAPVCGAIDRAGNLFIGTDGYGLIRINPSIRKFRHLIPPATPNLHQSGNFITAIYKDSTGLIYLGTLGSGLLITGPDQKLLKDVQYFENNHQRIRRVYFIVPWHGNRLLAGTDLGLGIYAGGNRLIPFENTSGSKVYTHISRLDQKRWVLGGVDGVSLLNENLITKIETGHVDQVTLLHALGNNTVLIAEWHDKLYRLEFLPGGNSELTALNFPQQNLRQKPVFYQAAVTNDALFIATSFGLMSINHSNNVATIYNVSNGLPDNTIYSIEKDKSGNLWLGTNQGLSRYSPQDGTFRNFNMTDGLQSMEFNAGASFYAQDGEMFFGGVNGVNAFFPDRMKINKITPGIFLTGIRVNDQSLNVDSLFPNHSIRFHYSSNNITFSLIALEYTLPERNGIRVRLSGLDHQWIDIPDGSSEVRYPFLPPGKYTLMATASNSDGVWSDPYTLFEFTVEKPYWQQTWFLVTAMVLFAGLVFLIFQVYYMILRRREKAVKRQRQAIEEVRARIAGEIHDDIGAGLTRIAILARQNGNEALMALDNKYASQKMERLASITQELIQSLGEIVWMINPARDSLQSLLVFLRKILNSMTEDSGFEPVCIFPDEIPDVDILPETRRRLSLMVKECINNAMKHSCGNTIAVSCRITSGSMIELVIEDNGKGFSTENPEYGNGLHNLRKHAEVIGFELRIHSEQPGGTRVTFSGFLQSQPSKRRTTIF
jgi:signal transduction histidine kinase/ligand-binding sensor domain-containing protein